MKPSNAGQVSLEAEQERQPPRAPFSPQPWEAQNPFPAGRRVRMRAILLGLGLVPLLCWWSMRTEIISGGSELIEASLLAIVVFTLFLITLVNDVVRRRRPRAALTRVELIFIYVMQTTSVGLAGLGQIQFLNQALGGAYYYATPENHWEKFFAYIPRWWVPDRDVLETYFKGGSTFFTLAHLRGWAVPILVWTGFILTLLFCFLCLNTMLRRHWVEHERLTFPLTALPLELTQEGATRSLLRHRAFWAAFGFVCLFRSVTGLHRILPSFPDFASFGNKGQLIDLQPFFANPPWSAIGYFRLSFHPLIIGITYFLPLDVAFSAWFFYLVVKAELILAAALGYSSPDASPAAQAIPYTGEQGAGAFLAVALFSFWGARRHLRAVFRKAFGRAPEVRDSDEPLSYRTAVFGFLAAFAALVAFTTFAGMPWLLSALFFALYLLMITACTRFRAEAGPMLGYGPDMNPHRMLVVLPGPQKWDVRALTTFSYLQWFDSDYRTVAMPQQMEALKMTEVTGGSARKLAGWMLFAAALASASAFVSVLAIYYHYGAITPRGDNNWRIYNAEYPFRTLMNWLESPTPPDPIRLRWMIGGFVIVSGLIRARTLFTWWPFHPVGFALAHAGWAMPWVWFATFLGWAAKSLILRYGGMSLYRRGVPLFMGLILGDIVIACVWSIIGVFLDTQMYMFFPG